MRRLTLTFAALTSAALIGCGGGSPPPGVPPRPPSPQPTICHPRNPPALGECVAQHFGITPTHKLGGSPATGSLCIDVSQWQGRYPNFTGLACVILQSNYGLNVEPSIYEQIRDANEHHVPWGCYTFMEGANGGAEARLANSICSTKRGRTLGIWGDAEVGAAYAHACEYTREAQALRINVYGIYSAPGIYAGGHCAGWLWPAEWGISSPYPFAGYSYSSILLHQLCGSGCFRFGQENDLDRDRGLVAFSHPTPPKPKPKPHKPLSKAQRRALERDITIVRGRLARYGCRKAPYHGRGRAHATCIVLFVRGDHDHLILRKGFV